MHAAHLSPQSLIEKGSSSSRHREVRNRSPPLFDQVHRIDEIRSEATPRGKDHLTFLKGVFFGKEAAKAFCDGEPILKQQEDKENKGEENDPESSAIHE